MPAARDHTIAIAFLRQCLACAPETGVATWLKRPREHFTSTNAWAVWNAKFAGKPAGRPDALGYLRVQLTFGDRVRRIKAHGASFFSKGKIQKFCTPELWSL
jgi:hypothetical protein